MSKISKRLLSALEANPIVPVLTLNSETEALEMGKRLDAGGYTTAEVTLRTDAALDAISVLRKKFPNMVVGAGTILSPDTATAAATVGAEFLVTPATTPTLAAALVSTPLPVLPGVATASEAQTLYEMGYEMLKFFPAEANGGVTALKSLAGPLPHLKFMPTGGVKEHTALDYLALPNVVAVGGSWMTK